MLGDLENESVTNTLDFKGIENWWKISLELDIDNGTDDLRDLTNSNDFSREVSYTIEKWLEVVKIKNAWLS